MSAFPQISCGVLANHSSPETANHCCLEAGLHYCCTSGAAAFSSNLRAGVSVGAGCCSFLKSASWRAACLQRPRAESLQEFTALYVRSMPMVTHNYGHATLSLLKKTKWGWGYIVTSVRRAPRRRCSGSMTSLGKSPGNPLRQDGPGKLPETAGVSPRRWRLDGVRVDKDSL